MPGGFLKKLGTASCGITGTLVAVARLCAATLGTSRVDAPARTTATTMAIEMLRWRFMRPPEREVYSPPDRPQGGFMTKLAILTVALAIGSAQGARADVTLKQTTGGKGLGLSGSAPGTTYIKGNKMRADVVMGDKTMTSIYDLDAQKMYVFDSKKKEADVWDMAAFAQEWSKSVDTSSAKASLKPNGQTKQVGGKSATGYDLEETMNAAFGGSKDMNMTVTLAGPIWVVKGAPGSADYGRFYKAAAEKGFIFSNPAAAKAQPG